MLLFQWWVISKMTGATTLIVVVPLVAPPVEVIGTLGRQSLMWNQFRFSFNI
jgi:hypothetical protein